MAIKTKKITDLGKITIDGEHNSLTDGDFYVIGCKAGVTGKIATQEIYKSIETLVTNDTRKISNEVDVIKSQVSSIADTPATVSASCDCEEKIAALEAKVAALEGFVKALQEEGYLTLAKIKQAAVEACPIETPAE